MSTRVFLTLLQACQSPVRITPGGPAEGRNPGGVFSAKALSLPLGSQPHTVHSPRSNPTHDVSTEKPPPDSSRTVGCV